MGDEGQAKLKKATVLVIEIAGGFRLSRFYNI
jgi:hypothetical protein